MNFIKEAFLQPEEHQVLKTLLEKENLQFQPSEVYNSLTEEKLIKPDKRTSEFRTLTTPEIFGIAKKVLERFNEKMKKASYCLFENDIMHIRYEAGGFFKDHEDYLSITSNLIDEYTLLICVDANSIGGETLLHLNEDFTYQCKKTIIPGGCLLFRKDISHEGSLIKSGTKEIVSFNVWLIKEDVSKILSVNFVNDERHVLLSVDDILQYYPYSLLGVFLNSGLTKDKKEQKIISYDSVHSYEEFEIIAKIYRQEAITFTSVHQYEEIIDYYLLEKKNILSKAIENVNQKAIKNNSAHVNEDMIIFGSSVYYEEFLQQVKDNHLSYVPFKVVFAEGSLAYGGGMTGTPTKVLKMMPLWCSFSEADNIMFHAQPMKNTGFGGKIDTSVRVKDLIYDWEDSKVLDSQKFEALLPGEPFNFAFEYDEDEEGASKTISMDEDSYWESYWNFNLDCCALDVTNTKLIKFLTSRSKALSYTKPPIVGQDAGAFALDDENRCILLPDHIEAIRSIIDENFYDKIINNLNNILIPNSQRTLVSKDKNYCNENVYGNFNLIVIYGFLKI
jgi:hypothetical protein